MHPLFSIGRASAGPGGASAPFGSNHPGDVSFGKKLEYVIDTTTADRQRLDAGKGVQVKCPRFAPCSAAGAAAPTAGSAPATQLPQGATGSPAQQSGNTSSGTSGEYQLDTAPATLDPRSMAFLLAWMGGSTDVQSIREQQQSYLETYRLRYPNGVPGVSNYVSATTNYLTGAS
jgi:hypothetical protein